MKIKGTNRSVVSEKILAGEKPFDGVPVCVGCDKAPYELSEYYVENRGYSALSNIEYVRKMKGTYNALTGHFLCTECYINAGMPSNPWGWVAE